MSILINLKYAGEKKRELGLGKTKGTAAEK